MLQEDQYNTLCEVFEYLMCMLKGVDTEGRLDNSTICISSISSRSPAANNISISSSASNCNSVNEISLVKEVNKFSEYFSLLNFICANVNYNDMVSSCHC